jgi:hypothetical protein
MESKKKISAKHYAAIGRAVDIWADFDHAIDIFIWDLMGVIDPIGACLTSQIVSTPNKLNALLALINLYGIKKTTKDEISNFVNKKVFGMIDQRNKIVHSKRLTDHERQPFRLLISAKKVLAYEAVIERTEDIDRFSINVKNLIKHFTDIKKRIESEIKTLPDISQQQLPYINRLKDQSTLRYVQIAHLGQPQSLPE